MPHRVAILAYDRLCMFEFGCAVELFALERPELEVDWYQHLICAVEPGPLRGTGGIQVQAPHGLNALRRADTIVVPGWRDPAERAPEPLLAALRKAHARGARICSICSGVFVLAHAGLLEGRRATTHWRYAQRLADTFPSIQVDSSSLYIDEGQVITSAGSAAGLDMLMHLVRKDHGSQVANAVAQRLVMAPQREGGQAQFVPRPMPSRADSPMARLQAHLRAHPRDDHRVESLARHVGMSPRSLQRHFKASTGLALMDWLVRERVGLAKELLETRPQLDVEAVADLSGLGSPESLRRHFRQLGLPAPSRYRRQFG
ncbi:transcriptional regulator FtrA [Roseateles sp. SL47]|uniref:transcriptional regulator FtrA n=1 Tax=Roseateles sp. SL47 TaxID=2995138 RepID=UPI00226EA10A|nr:transcriptional regulator FtrA [Roseateles sp. SL47]WAC74633.1 transcriptional regulator FtrA [Roseateles sp. SL47]